jgi:hypothetical protein
MKEAAISKRGGQTLSHTGSGSVLGLPVSRTGRNKFLLFKPLGLWYFVTASLGRITLGQDSRRKQGEGPEKGGEGRGHAIPGE